MSVREKTQLVMGCMAAAIATGPISAQPSGQENDGANVRLTPPSSPSASAPQTAPAPGSQSAETDGSGLGDILVTAQRRSENLQRVPVAVTVNTGDSLAAKAIVSSADLAAVTPSLTYTTGVGFALPRIRGVGSATTLGGNENSVATYIDGVYVASATSSLLALNNIEQVSVLKGPQGTLFGRNATGGLIQITTRTPKHNLEVDASVTIADPLTYGGQLYVTDGLSDTIAADLAVYYMDQREGFGTNLFNGQDVNKNRDFSVRSKLLVDVGDALRATLALDYSNAQAAQSAFRPVYGSIPITGVPYTGGKFDIDSNRQPSFKTEQGGVGLTLDYDVGGAKLTSITAYRKSTYRGMVDNDKLPVQLTETNPYEPDSQFSQELQLASDRGRKLDWVLGAYYFGGNSRFASLAQLASSALFTDVRQRARAGAVFGQGTYHLGERTNVTAGLRYTIEKRYLDASSYGVNSAGVITNNPDVQGTTKADRLTWRIAFDHQLSERTLAYVSYNRGFKSGGFNPTRATLPLLPFAPESLDAYELGIKTDLADRKIRINAATFYYNYKNIQLTAFNNAITTIFNAASAKIYGLDLDAQFAPTRELTFTLGASLIHDRFGDFPGATFSVPRGTGGNVLTTGNARGNRLPTTPDWTINVGADYKKEVSFGEFALSLNYFHSDGWAAEADNRLRQAAYDVLNGSVGLEFGDKQQYNVRVWGRNLTNTAYAQQINSSALVDGVTIAPGRSIGVTAGIRFR
jgi:iron complex outermembrane receptor protein